MRRTLAALTIALAACAPATGTGDAASPADAAPEAAPALDVVATDTQPEAAPPAEAAAPDARLCATDMDRDGHISIPCGGDDCDDNNARVYPGQLPRCDITIEDSDCNGTPDAMEADERTRRCVTEYPTATGMTLVATIVCAPEATVLSCRACRTRDGTRTCLCWRSGDGGNHVCAP